MRRGFETWQGLALSVIGESDHSSVAPAPMKPLLPLAPLPQPLTMAPALLYPPLPAPSMHLAPWALPWAGFTPKPMGGFSLAWLQKAHFLPSWSPQNACHPSPCGPGYLVTPLQASGHTGGVVHRAKSSNCAQGPSLQERTCQPLITIKGMRTEDRSID